MYAFSLILFLVVRNIPEEIWSISNGCPPVPPTLPRPPPPPSITEVCRDQGTLLLLTSFRHQGRGQDLCLQFFEKIRYFTPFDRISGIRSASGIRPTCLCPCPPLHALKMQTSHNIYPFMASFSVKYAIYIPSNRVISSPFLHRTFFFMKFCEGTPYF